MHADGTLKTVDTRSVRAGDGWQGIDRDLTAEAPGPRAPRQVPQIERPGVAVVRWPVVDGRREVVGYELVGDGSVLGAFAPDELVELGGGRPVWVGLDGEDVPELPRDRAVLQLAPDAPPERAQALAGGGLRARARRLRGQLAAARAVRDRQGRRVRPRATTTLRALIAEPASRGLVLVATGVQTADEFTRCRVLGFSHFQGEFFARPRGESGSDGVGQGAVASLQALAELTGSDASFEDLERIIGADVGLSIALLRHVNSAFFSLPRKIDTVREALTLLGTRAVRRWATVVALSSVPEVAGPARRARAPARRACASCWAARPARRSATGCSRSGCSRSPTRCSTRRWRTCSPRCRSPTRSTGALLRGEGRRGRILASVLRYEQGHFPDGAEGDPIELAEAYLEALKWADDAGRWLA